MKVLPYLSLLLLFGLSACGTGFIYTDITLPLTENMDSTPSTGVAARSSVFSVKEPITSVGVTAEWKSYAIGDAAERAGLSKLHYADLRVVSYFGGVFKRTSVTVYGEKDSTQQTPAEKLP